MHDWVAIETAGCSAIDRELWRHGAGDAQYAAVGSGDDELIDTVSVEVTDGNPSRAETRITRQRPDRVLVENCRVVPASRGERGRRRERHELASEPRAALRSEHWSHDRVPLDGVVRDESIVQRTASKLESQFSAANGTTRDTHVIAAARSLPCGDASKFGAQVERWRAAGADIARTDRDGAITVTIDAAGKLAIERFPR
ncbi:MAG TPA: hypothetical protein VFD36_29945 [Kofleriaceae bacterium]|nr:hypothetical protein [Kofleriaceae bacterium]